MNEQQKPNKFVNWLVGLFTGAVVAAPVTALICNKVYNKKLQKAVDEAETRGIYAMGEYAIQQQAQEDISQEAEQKQEQETPSEPEPEEKVYSEEDYAVAEDPREYDTYLDEFDEEAKERTETHVRYLDAIDKYRNGEEIRPRVISMDEYDNEHIYEKSSVNWYERDNVFEENLEIIEDPYYTFGVTDGHDLFRDTQYRFDDDICYVRNETLSTDFEISRIHGSYAEIVGGESSLGETDT